MSASSARRRSFASGFRGRDGGFERAEMPREIDVLLIGEFLPRKDQHGIVPEGLLDRRDICRVERARQIDVADLGGETFCHREYRDRHRGPPLSCADLGRGCGRGLARCSGEGSEGDSEEGSDDGAGDGPDAASGEDAGAPARMLSKKLEFALTNWPSAITIWSDISGALSLPTRNTEESSNTSPGSLSE